MQSVIMLIGMNINENGGKKHRIKYIIPGNWLKGEEIIKTLNDSQMNNAMR